MGKNEKLALIAKKIEGQGNQVDAGSTLPELLKAIVTDMANESVVDNYLEFAEDTAYEEGNVVRHDGDLYVFTEDYEGGEWDESVVESTNAIAIAVKQATQAARALIIKSAQDETIDGIVVPGLDVDQVTAAYNAIVGGRGAIVESADGTAHCYVNQADNLNDELSIGILYYSTALVTYTIDADAVVITAKSLEDA